METSLVPVPQKTLEMLPAVLFNAMIFVKDAEQDKGRSDAAQIQQLLKDIDTARNDILKLLGYRVSPED